MMNFVCRNWVTQRAQSSFARAHSATRARHSNQNSVAPSSPYNTYRCNVIITDCFRRGDVEAARKLFDEMPQRNLVTWNCMVSGYVHNYRLSEAHSVFDIMPRRNVVSWTALLTGYARCGMLEEAEDLFHRMPEKNTICWNSMITGYLNNNRIEMARATFDTMPDKNTVSWAIMIGGYLKNELVVEARALFDCAPDKESSLYNAMLCGYANLGYVEDAFQLFLTMPQRDVASWTTMITCHSRCGLMDVANQLFVEMPDKCVEAWTAIIWGYMQSGEIKAACKCFEEMPQRDAIAWNSMIGGYVHNGMLEDALKLFIKMPGRDLRSWNSILKGFVQWGDLVNACTFFEHMPFRDEASWNTIISGYQTEEALSLFSRMIREQYKPDQGTLTIAISVCASLAIHSYGRSVHLCAIRYGYEHDAKVVCSLITMYSKCGLIANASLLFERMARLDLVAWNAMIVAQAYHGSALEALGLFPRMLHAGFEPNHVSFLGLLSACAHKGLVNEGWEIFDTMQKKWKLVPKAEHLTCMVDLLGRSGQLNEAHEFIKQIHMDLPPHAWESLLSACRIHGNLELGELVAMKILSFQPQNSVAYVLLSNIYAAKGMWKNVTRIRNLMIDNGAIKEQASSWIEIKGKVSAFMYNDRTHPQSVEIYRQLDSLSVVMEENGDSTTKVGQVIDAGFV